MELKLILEVDGADHFTEEGRERDRVREEALAREGYLVVRISGLTCCANRSGFAKALRAGERTDVGAGS